MFWTFGRSWNRTWPPDSTATQTRRRPEFFTIAYFHTSGGLAGEIERAGLTGLTV